ncbi:MAG: hypothetical protein K2R98_26005 [Gemmataceae bacterium]|nr:hypothetical protein [Gemmataceae bacterium]
MKRLVFLVIAVLLLGCDSSAPKPGVTFTYEGGGRPAPDFLEVKVTAASFSPDGRYLLLGHGITRGDRAVIPDHLQLFVLWDLAKRERVASWGGQNGSIRSVQFLPDSRRVLSISHSRGLALVEIPTGKEIWRAQPYGQGMGLAFCVSPDGRLALTVGCEDTSYVRIPKLWDTQRGEVVRSLAGVPGDISTFSISPDHKLALSGCQGRVGQAGLLRVWRLSDGEALRTLEGSEGWGLACAFLPDNKSAIVSKDGKPNSGEVHLVLLSVTDGEPVRTFGEGRTLFLGLTPDGKHLITSTGRGTIVTWEVESGNKLRSVELALEKYLDSMVCSPDGKLIFTSTGSPLLKRIRNQLWSVEDGKLVSTLDID